MHALLVNVDATRLFLVDEQQLFADVLLMGLKSTSGVRVAGHRTPRDPQLSLALTGAQPDVVSVDVEQLGARLPTDIEDWRRAAPRARFAALTGSRDPALAAQAVRAGIHVWIPKESSTERLVELVHVARAGHAWYPPALLAQVFVRLPGDRRARPRPLDVLSHRENDVLRAMVDGARGPEIARRLNLSRHTVRTHMRNIFRKLNVHSGLELVKLARAAGLGPDNSSRKE
ncbi:response regulator transcription factor [Amycolatopsis sp. GM8]|uniref:response regulator transcription factor n=1 Tax=Amycolatopsis sp. GM8 TaxID=2896530 RepID=UPI001F382B84|nr:response regulator transcription factor [Amycolatopsis sp. GM8]